ncbi:uncharacterized protein L199_005064 [Kwoniella botswanensis]|uniref:uncharacterized protein n=1 Tax=Kwoniella botswanensis TaxID=1268659 RepID=UPI00315CDF27
MALVRRRNTPAEDHRIHTDTSGSLILSSTTNMTRDSHRQRRRRNHWEAEGSIGRYHGPPHRTTEATIVHPDRLEILMRVETYHFLHGPGRMPNNRPSQAFHQDFLTTLQINLTVPARIYQSTILRLKTIITTIQTTDGSTIGKITCFPYAYPPSGELSVSCRDAAVLGPARDVVGSIRQE